jgi:hypothetical protein
LLGERGHKQWRKYEKTAGQFFLGTKIPKPKQNCHPDRSAA